MFCIYDNDIDWQVLRIDSDKPFSKIPRDNPITSVVLRSTCKVERVLRGETNDWTLIASSVERMDPRRFKSQALSFVGLVTNQKQIANSMRNFGDQGQYSGDVVVPRYQGQQETKPK